MRTARSECGRAIDPRRHYLVVITAEHLHRRPLALPIFEIVDGRHGRVVDGRSREGARILADGSNVLYVGATNALGAPVRNVALGEVLGLLLDSGPDARLRAALEVHIADLAARRTARAAGAAA